MSDHSGWPIVHILDTSDHAVVLGDSMFTSNRRCLIIAIPHTATEDEIRDAAPDALIAAMTFPTLDQKHEHG